MRHKVKDLVYGVVAFLTLDFFSLAAVGEEMTLERVDNRQILILHNDQTFEVKWLLESKSPDQRGVFETTDCWGGDSNKSQHGNYMFYQEAGERCCMSFRAVGSKKLLAHVAGSTYSVCTGGVYQQK